MEKGEYFRGLTIAVLSLLAVPLCFASTVYADRFSSPNYTIDASAVGGSISGPQSSTNYRLVSSGGDSIIGDAQGGSYKLGQGYVAQLEKALQLTVQPGGLLAYYPLDDPLAQTILDYSGSGAHLKITGSPNQIPGKLGAALRSGNNQSAQIDNGSTLNTSNLTVSAWLNNDGWGVVDENGTAVGRQVLDSPINGDWMLGRSGGERFRFRVTVGGSDYTVQSENKAANQWHHVVGTYDGTDIKIYVNGVLEGSLAVSGGALPNTTTPFAIGQRGNQTSPYWNGGIDEVKVYNRALSQSEIQAEYTAQNLGTPAGLAFGSAITPGVSQTATFDAVVQTDAPGYTLAMSQNTNLTNGTHTIPGIAGTIASPTAWSEGATKGLGFTLYHTNATAIPAKWNSGNSYAALPTSATSFYTRTGYTGGNKDILQLRLRLDVPTTQVNGQYANQMTITGTITP